MRKSISFTDIGEQFKQTCPATLSKLLHSFLNSPGGYLLAEEILGEFAEKTGIEGMICYPVLREHVRDDMKYYSLCFRLLQEGKGGEPYYYTLITDKKTVSAISMTKDYPNPLGVYNDDVDDENARIILKEFRRLLESGLKELSPRLKGKNISPPTEAVNKLFIEAIHEKKEGNKYISATTGRKYYPGLKEGDITPLLRDMTYWEGVFLCYVILLIKQECPDGRMTKERIANLTQKPHMICRDDIRDLLKYKRRGGDEDKRMDRGILRLGKGKRLEYMELDNGVHVKVGVPFQAIQVVTQEGGVPKEFWILPLFFTMVETLGLIDETKGGTTRILLDLPPHHSRKLMRAAACIHTKIKALPPRSMFAITDSKLYNQLFGYEGQFEELSKQDRYRFRKRVFSKIPDYLKGAGHGYKLKCEPTQRSKSSVGNEMKIQQYS